LRAANGELGPTGHRRHDRRLVVVVGAAAEEADSLVDGTVARGQPAQLGQHVRLGDPISQTEVRRCSQPWRYDVE